MGQPACRDGQAPRKRGQVAELKHLSRPRKRDYSLSSGERTGKSPNRFFRKGAAGLWTTIKELETED
jgi:hypothetical protein